MSNKIIIPDNLNDTALLCYLYPTRFRTEDEKKAVVLLHKICSANLSDFHDYNQINDLILNDEEREIILYNEWNCSDNLEVRARCNDVLCRFENDKRSIKKTTSESYLKAYKTFGEIEFLIRSITVRNFKAINTPDFLSEIINVICQKFEHPFWMNKVIESLAKSYTIEDMNAIKEFVEKEKLKSRNENKYDVEREYINASLSLKAIQKHSYHKQLALSYESEADAIANNKKHNTYYPTLVGIYQKAYNEIFEIKDHETEIYSRIKDKLLNEKNVFIDMLSTYGVKSKLEIPEAVIQNIEDRLTQVFISNFIDTINLMRNVPFIEMEIIEKYISCKSIVDVVDSFSDRTQLNEKGNVVGFADSEKSIRTVAHVFFRQINMYRLYSIVGLHRWSNIQSKENVVHQYLKQYKPQFIEEDNLIFWTKGITAGLNSDFIPASHILMPQLEHALHNIAEEKLGNITSLEKKRQEVPTLGSILPMLKGIIKEEVLFELDSFLQSGIDVNFRNNLLHGLMSPFEVEKYGLYLWWICLRLYFDYNSLENLEETTEKDKL